MPDIKKWFIEHRYELLLVLLITIFGFFLRTWDIMSERIHGDPERVHLGVVTTMYNNILADKFGIGSWLLTLREFGNGILIPNKGPGYFWFSIIAAKFLSPDYSAVRYTSALFGTLTIPLVYLIGKIAFSKKVGIISAFLLATVNWHVYYSRLGYADPALIFFIALTMVFVLYGFAKSDSKWILLSTFPMALMLLIKFSQGFPVVLAMLIIILISKRRLLIPYLIAIAVSFIPLLMWASYLEANHHLWTVFRWSNKIYPSAWEQIYLVFFGQSNLSPSLFWFGYSFATPRLGFILIPALISTVIVLSNYKENSRRLIVLAGFWIPTILLIMKGLAVNAYYFMISAPAYVILASHGLIEIVERIKAEKVIYAALGLAISIFYAGIALGTTSFYYGFIEQGAGSWILNFVLTYALIAAILALFILFCSSSKIEFKFKRYLALIGIVVYIFFIAAIPVVFLFNIFSTNFLL